MSIVWTDSNITIAALIEVIHYLTTYRVHYDKAWRAKEHALTLLWGDWREAYVKVPRLLNAISHFKPGTRCVIDTCGQWLPNEKSILSGVEASILVLSAVCGWLRILYIYN
jgi:hypothetical protein